MVYMRWFIVRMDLIIKKFDNEDFYMYEDITYYKGYLLHREDGPAGIWDDDLYEWYLNGKEYSEQEYLNIISLKSKSRVLDDI